MYLPSNDCFHLTHAFSASCDCKEVELKTVLLLPDLFLRIVRHKGQKGKKLTTKKQNSYR